MALDALYATQSLQQANKTSAASGAKKPEMIHSIMATPPKQDKSAVELNIKHDYKSGTLEREGGFAKKIRTTVLKFDGGASEETKKMLSGDIDIFHSDKLKDEKGKSKKLTFGEIAKRYNLPDGVLKKANQLKISGPDKRGDDISKYYPGEMGSSKDVFIPAEYLDKY